MKCPECGSQVDHSNLVNGPRGEEYYACPQCERKLVYQMSFGKVFLLSVFALPVLWVLLNVLISAMLGPFFGDEMILGIEATAAIAAILSIVAVALLAKYSIRLVEQ